MARRIHPFVTPTRLAWLERLDREEFVNGRGRGRAGFDCMRLGWTQWIIGSEDRRVYGETLTSKGRQILAQERR